MPKKSRSTQTSSFGSPGRASHDASPFYNSKMYSGLEPQPAGDGSNAPESPPLAENPLPLENTNRIFCSSAERMAELPDRSVHLMVTSPPYNVGKDYDADLTLEEYLAFLKRVWSELLRALAPGGRACINIANLGRKPYIPLHAFIIKRYAVIGFSDARRDHLG